MALPLEFRDLCRACMKRRDDMKMFFFSRINSVNVASMLTKIALLPVEPSDSLPKVLCSLCIRKLNDAYNFQQMCIKSHITFNDMLQTQRLPPGVVIKKEPCELTISSVESQAAKMGVDKYKTSSAAKADQVLKEPKIEPGIEQNSQGANDSFKSEANSKAPDETKKFTCNFCRDIFETWIDLTLHIAEHKVRKNGRTGDDSSCEEPEKKRKMSEASTSKENFPTENCLGGDSSVYDGRSENSGSIDGLPLEPICNVQVKDEIESEQSSCEYDEDDHEESVKNNQNCQNGNDGDDGEDDENQEYQKHVKIEKPTKNGRNFTDSKSMVCEMCGFKPKIPALMHAHVRNRHPDNYMEYVENLKASGEWVVRCRICDVYLFSSTIYGQHLKYTHSQIVNDCSGYFECNHCDQTFSSKNDFFLHKNQAHNMRRINKAKQLFMCLLCDKQFSRYVNLQQHEETHESNGTSAMAIGNGRGSASRVSSVSGNSSGFIALSGFLRKKRAETTEDIAESPSIVPFIRTSPKKYTNSNITTAAGGKFQCHGCDKSFATEFGLRVHIGCVHKGMEKLPPKKSGTASLTPVKKPPPPPPPTVIDNYCEICEKQFDSGVDCGIHMQKHYDVAYSYKERPIRCKECKFQCATRSDFKNHIKQRHKEIYRKRIAGLATLDQRFEACNLCFISVFRTKIIRHMNSHYMPENEKKDDSDELVAPAVPINPPNAQISPKEHPNRLNENGKTIKYKCKICSTFYPDKSSLMKHTLIVHKKPERKHFNCKICFRSITGLQNFNSHMNAHKGELPKATPKNSHACHLCSGIFVEREDLQKHLVVAHSFNPMIFYKK